MVAVVSLRCCRCCCHSLLSALLLSWTAAAPLSSLLVPFFSIAGAAKSCTELIVVLPACLTDALDALGNNRPRDKLVANNT